MKLFWIATILVIFARTDKSSGKVCTQQQLTTVTKTEYYTSNCGWWGWSRCQRSRLIYDTETETVNRCCTGSFGRVESGCNGDCPYSSTQSSSACPGNGLCRDYKCVQTGFGVSSPVSSALAFNENDNDEKLLWNTSATCFVQSRCDCATEQFVTSGTCTCSKAVPCTKCSVQSTDNIAEVRNGKEIWRRKCTKPDCKVCKSLLGCLDHNVKYDVTVQCTATGYDDNGQVTQAISLVVTEAKQPNISIAVGSSSGTNNRPEVVADAKTGDVVIKLAPIIIPDDETNVQYTLKGPKSSTTGKPLFKYNSTTGEITVNADLSTQPPGNYTLDLCVALRRGETCASFAINILPTTTTSTTTTTTTPIPTTTTKATTTPIPGTTTKATTTPIPGTTTKATTTPILTTTQSEPTHVTVCIGAGQWRTVPGFDYWCQLVCGDNPTNCTYIPNHCRCLDANAERLNCTAVGLWQEQFKSYMDGWCDLNCNAGEYSNCPEDYCECNP